MHKKILLGGLLVIAGLLVSGLFAAEYYTSRPSFCGSCHMMKKYYNTWKTSIHSEKNIVCVDCHVLPGQTLGMQSTFRGLRQIFTYLGAADKSIRTRTRISDESCSTAECHGNEQFMDKKIAFTEKTSYIHNTHFDKTIEGQELHCATCHSHVREDRHFEVPKAACYLCHFKEAAFNEGRGKCALCHEISTKPLQKHKNNEVPDEEPMTHQSLEQAGVPCKSCHYQLIQGSGEIKKENCFTCHEYSDEKLKQAEDKKSMHTRHIAEQKAGCFDCHRPIEHKEIEFLDPVREACVLCHPSHHKYQMQLLLGYNRGDGLNTPGLMYDVKTNCIGCHVEEKIKEGEKVLTGSPKACAACHSVKQEAMVENWKKKTREELAHARELEKKAQEAIGTAKGKVSRETLNNALVLLEKGQENVNVVAYGGGVHNMKFSLLLLDFAMNDFEKIIDMLAE